MVVRMNTGGFAPSPVRCIRCTNTARSGASHCRVCGLLLSGPQVGELRWIDDEIVRLDRARASLIHRRMALLAELARQGGATVAAPTADPLPAGASSSGASSAGISAAE